MTDTNSSAPASTVPPAAGPEAPAVSGGERVLAVFALAFAALIIAMAVDMLTGGKITGMARGDDDS